MPSASGTQQDPPPDPVLTPAAEPAQPGAGRDPVLVREREYISQSRQFLRLMREDVLSLRALGGDPVSEEYLKADLYRRAEALKDIPGTPLFFGRVDYSGRADGSGASAAPGSGSFAGEQVHMGLRLRRRFGFFGADLTAYEDERFGGPRLAGGAGPAGAASASRILIDEIE